MVAYRLGIDMGSNSLGWCLLALGGDGEPRDVMDAGGRIIAAVQEAGRDPQSGASLAADRRLARGARRRRDRQLFRKGDLMKALIRHGLMPTDKTERKQLEGLDPYELRAKGLDRKLTPSELGRALFHLHQRRGFKSNRKTDSKDSESGAIRAGVDKLRKAIKDSGARTYGEFLYRRHQEKQPVRARNISAKAKAEYAFYPALGPTARDEIHGIMFRQRPLKPVVPGKCSFNPDEDRAPRALPSSQRFRIHEELGNLMIARAGGYKRKLTLDERDILLRRLLASGRVEFESLHKSLKLAPDQYFNLESERRKALKGDETAAVLAHRDRFGPDWRRLPFERQQAIVGHLLGEENEDKLVAWLRAECGLERGAAEKVSRAGLPTGHLRLGPTASMAVLKAFETGNGEAVDPETGEITRVPLTYDQAVAAAGYHHSDLDRRGEDDLLARLPYYGDVLSRHVVENQDAPPGSQERRGRITNPTVHIGLNQLRHLVNALIEAHGPPAEIVIELARELKMGLKQKAEVSKRQAVHQKANEARVAQLAGIGIADPSGQDLMKMRLWEELDPKDRCNRHCPYSGDQISLARLFSGEVEIEHILPFRRTLDNSGANKTVAMRRTNRFKSNQSPHEAFAASPGEFDWAAITARAARLPDNKRWRFEADAMERFENEERGFLDRQLVDTQYMARISKTYLAQVCPANKVWAVPGRLTAMLRGKWGLNSLLPDHNVTGKGQPKNRTDHRHHAIDAFVIACTRRGLLQKVAAAADEDRSRLIVDMPDPFPGYDRARLEQVINDIVVSHRADHGTGGKLHEETAYGAVADPQAWDGHNLVYRKPLAGLNEREVARIRDRALRERVDEYLYEAKGAGVDHKTAMSRFVNETGIRRARLLKKERDVIAIRDRAGRAYKFYSPGDNHRVEIYDIGDGKWRGEGVSVFDANQPGFAPAWRTEHPGARLVMRVHKGDLLRLEYEGRDQVMVVRQLDVSANRFKLVGHRESGNLQARHVDPDDPFRWLMASYSTLKKAGARKVRVDVLGKVWNVREDR